MTTQHKKDVSPSNTFSQRALAAVTLLSSMMILLTSFQNCGGGFETANLSSTTPLAGMSDPVVPGNKVPTFKITSPANNANLIAGNTVTIAVDATDPDGSIARVELYVNGSTTRVDDDNTAPFQVQYNEPYEGTYDYVVKIIDNRGGYTISNQRYFNAIVDPATTPLSTCYADNYRLPSWQNASDVSLNYSVGLGGGGPTVANVTSTYSPVAGSRGISTVRCTRVSGANDLTINCNATRLEINGTQPGVECKSGTIVIEARPDDGCENREDSSPAKKFTINYTNVCPAEKVIRALATNNTSDAQDNASFGARVAKSSSTVVVSAPGYSLMSGTTFLKRNVGAAYVYTKNTATNNWDYVTRLLPENAVAGAQITAVSISNDVIALGTLTTSDSASKGEVFVYEKVGNTWTHTATLRSPLYDIDATTKFYPVDTISNSSDRLYFGFRVKITPDKNILVSAHGEDVGAAVDAGAVYKFAKNSTTQNWEFKQKLTQATPISFSYFGYNFSVDNSYNLAIAAPIRSGTSETSSDLRAFYVFNGSANSNYNFNKEIKLAATTAVMQFGASINILGNIVAVGAPIRDSQRGGVYLFNVSSGTLIGKVITPADIAVNDEFGTDVQITSVATDKVTLFASSAGTVGTDKKGFIYKLEYPLNATATTEATQKFKLRARAAEFADKAQFGKSIAIEGSEIVVGSPNRLSDNKNNAGVSFVIATP